MLTLKNTQNIQWPKFNHFTGRTWKFVMTMHNIILKYCLEHFFNFDFFQCQKYKKADPLSYVTRGPSGNISSSFHFPLVAPYSVRCESTFWNIHLSISHKNIFREVWWETKRINLLWMSSMKIGVAVSNIGGGNHS